jgi:hypothetical protein
LPHYRKDLASFNHHLEPWFEGFTFIKDCTKDPERKIIKTARTSKQHQEVPLARHCELSLLAIAIKWFLLAIASYLYSPLRVNLLAVASWWRAAPQGECFACPGELFTRRGEL